MPVAKKKAAPKKKAPVKKAVVSKKAVAKPEKKQVEKKTSAPEVVVAKKKATARPSSSAPRGKPRSAADGFSFHGIEPYQEKRGEDYMNEPQRDHFRAILLAWKKELMEEVDRTLHYLQDEAANFPDPNDRASQESDFTMELRTRDRERKLIKKIEESISAIGNDEYGYCESCGCEIGVRRLEARPTATLCIDCKTLDEIREKQRS